MRRALLIIQAFGVSSTTFYAMPRADKGWIDQPMTVLDKVSRTSVVMRSVHYLLLQPLDLACVETQIGDGSPMDCEIVELVCSIHLLL